MCGGERVSNHTSPDSHHGCSCMPMAGVLPSSTPFTTLGLILAVGCCILPCAQGNNVELYRSHAAFRGATDITDEQLVANANLLSDSLTIWSPTSELISPDDSLFNSHEAILFNNYEATTWIADSFAHTEEVALPHHRRLQDLNTEEQTEHVHDHEHEHEHEHVHEHGEGHLTKGKVWTVVGAVLVILAVSLFGVFLPDLVKWLSGGDLHSSLGRVLESICTAFAAGGFWGLALIHVLLEAITSLDNLAFGLTLGESFMNAAFPLTCAGYAFMLAVEAFAKVWSKKAYNKQKNGANAYSGQNKLAVIDATIACLALTVHSVFEGMVIGMRDSNLLVWIACISVAGHKWAAAFALSQRMSSHDTPKSIRIIFLSIFVLSTPVGAFIGLPLSTMEDLPVVGILNALSAGVLIYVASECTADVFGGTHVHEEEEALKEFDQEAHKAHYSEDSLSHREVEMSAAHVQHKTDLEASVRLFIGRTIALIAGMALVFGMMCLHMKNPGHSHAHTH